jgi:hypothetical protein
MTEPAHFQWVNSYKIDEALSAEERDDVVDDLLDALDALLLNPTSPTLAFPLRGTDRFPDSYVALLPHQFTISYRVHSRGIPPHATPTLSVRHFGPGTELFNFDA